MHRMATVLAKVKLLKKEVQLREKKRKAGGSDKLGAAGDKRAAHIATANALLTEAKKLEAKARTIRQLARRRYVPDYKNLEQAPPPPTVDPTRLPNGGDAKSRQAFLPRPDAPAPERCRPSPRGVPSSPPPCSLRAEPRAGRDEAASGDRPVQAHRCARERGGVSCAVARRAHRSSLPPKSGGATPLAPPRAPVSPRVLRGRALPAGAQGSAKPWVGEARGSLA